MLWFGWFGFNAGSALAADGTAVTAFATTNTASAAAMLGWIFFDWLQGAQALGPGRLHRRRGRPGRDHPGGRIRHRPREHHHRAGRQRASATWPSTCGRSRTSTTPSTSSPATASAGWSGCSPPGSSATRGCWITASPPRAGQDADLRGPPDCPGGGLGLRLLRLVDPVQDHRPDHPAPRHARAGRPRPRPQPARRDGPRGRPAVQRRGEGPVTPRVAGGHWRL